MLPRLGADGILVDLEYLRAHGAVARRRGPGRGLAGPARPGRRGRPAAPGRAGGVPACTGIDSSRAALARQGPALALQFHLAAAVFGIVLALGGLGLVAAVDRRRRAEDLRALRRQGLLGPVVRRAALWGYLSIVVAGRRWPAWSRPRSAWLAAGDRLPVFTDRWTALPPPRWPVARPVLGRGWSRPAVAGRRVGRRGVGAAPARSAAP